MSGFRCLRVLAVWVVVGACGGDPAGVHSDSTVAETGVAGDTLAPDAPDVASDASDVPDVATATKSDLTGVSLPASPDESPTPDPECATADNPDYAATSGFTYPWQGLSHAGSQLTCNGCQSGIGLLQGAWRVHGYTDGTADYEVPDPMSDYAERIAIDGNTFEVHIRDALAEAEAVFRGFYACGETPEVPSHALFWVVLESDGVMWQSGDVFVTAVIDGSARDQIVIDYVESPGSANSFDYSYCRIGTLNPARPGQVCTDPL